MARETESIEITISHDGTIESEVHGVLGPDCEALIGWIEGLGKVVEHRRTPDYSRHQCRLTRQHIGRS